MNAPTPEQIAKLPKWAQDHIKNLDRRMVVAERTLKEYQDAQTPSPVFYDDLLCVGEGGPKHVRRFVQTRRISIVNDGIRVDVMVRGDGDKGVEVSWGDDGRLCREVAMVPISFQKMKILTKEDMRA